MFSYASVLVLSVFSASAMAQSFTVASPATVVQCQPAALSWSGGSSPYFASIIPGGQPGALALKEFPQQTTTNLVWNVDLAQGTSITIQVRDGGGNVQYSASLTIQNSSDASCLNASASIAPVGATTDAAASTPVDTAAPATTPAAGTTAAGTTAAGTTAAGSSSVSRAASSTASTSGAATTSAAANAAVNNGFAKSAMGFAGLAGLIGAALF